MASEWFSQAWAEEWCREINASEAYKKAAATWEWPLVLSLMADPGVGVTEDRAVWVDLYHGECRGARVAGQADLETAPYVVAGDPYTWKQVLDGRLEPLAALMQGRLKLVKGQVASLAAYAVAARELVIAARRVDTALPEGL